MLISQGLPGPTMPTKPAKQSAIKKAVTKKPAAKKSAAKTEVNKPEEVEAFMKTLDHPFKAEVQAVRKIIKGVNKNITEQIKWAAPSFSYKGYLVTVNLWAKAHVHLVFHDGAILSNKSGLLEGDYPDRRMAYFSSMKDVKAKQPALEAAIKEWVKLKDKK
jgi:hypothetical protein